MAADECDINNLSIPKGDPGDPGASVTVGVSVLRNYTTDTGTSANTTETDLDSYTNTPSTTNALTSDGDEVVATAIVTTGANANTKNIRLYFGGTLGVLFTTTANAKVMEIYMRVVRVSATSQTIYYTVNLDGSSSSVGKTTASVVLTNNQIIKVTGQNGSASANDIVLNNFNIKMFKKA